MEEAREEIAIEELTEEQKKARADEIEAYTIYIADRIEKSVIEADRRNAEKYNNAMQGEFAPLPKEYLDGEEDIEWNYKKEAVEKYIPQKFLYEEFVNSMSRNSIMMHTIIQSNLKKGIGGPSFLRRVWLDKPSIESKYNLKVYIDSIQAGKESRLYKEDYEKEEG